MISNSSLTDFRRSYTRRKSTGRRRCSHGRNACGFVSEPAIPSTPRQTAARVLRIQTSELFDKFTASFVFGCRHDDFGLDVLIAAVDAASFEPQARAAGRAGRDLD